MAAAQGAVIPNNCQVICERPLSYTIEDLKQRVSKFVNETRKQYPNKSILVTTHGGVIDAMHILFPQKEKIEADNAKLHEFQF